MNTYIRLAFAKASQFDLQLVRLALALALVIVVEIVPLGVPIGGGLTG